MVKKIIFTLAVAISATMVVAAITEEDKKEMIEKCDQLAQAMEGHYNDTVARMTAQIQENEAKLDMSNPREKSCFEKAARKYEMRLGMAADEAFNGYAFSAKSLKADIEENRLEEGELEHTKNMLKPNGRFETQVSNAILTVHMEETRLTRQFDAATKKCNKSKRDN